MQTTLTLMSWGMVRVFVTLAVNVLPEIELLVVVTLDKDPTTPPATAGSSGIGGTAEALPELHDAVKGIGSGPGGTWV